MTASSTTADSIERRTITYEWKLRGLKALFEASKGDQKSKVTKSSKFDDGRWQILFYANSGNVSGNETGNTYCSLYLSCEPTPDEEEAALDGKWTREGLYSFTFEVSGVEKRGERKVQFCTKDALNHAFSWKTANWGWASFARRDTVFYGQNAAIFNDAFVITCTISGPPLRRTAPRHLLTTIGALLDDPDYSDVQFVLPHGRSICAMRKLVARRASYFDTMFESGFCETEQPDTLQARAGSPDSILSDLQDDSDYEEDLEDDHDEHELVQFTPASAPLATPRPETAQSYEMFPNSTTPEPPLALEEPDTPPTPEESEQRAASGDSDAESNVEIESSPKKRSVPTIQHEPPPITLVQNHTQRQAKLDQMTRVVVRDSAYQTYKALLYYLYTDTIIFAPLSSSFDSSATSTPPSVGPIPQPEPVVGPATRREWIQAWRRQHPELARTAGGPCSAKSLYRLADKIGLMDLKERAFEHIVASLSVANIVDEVFGSFSATFAEVRKAEMDFFLAHWSEIRSSNAMRAIWPAMRSGRHPGFEDVWHLIVMNLDYRPSKDENGTTEMSSMKT
ncbi:hypothetical protein BKA62DRAFT_832360 [Auriculariales sp. MPI-PUGE-AT-0066]|nr:hypothetical protein BKA62DRAFT_832360 [Auriculariales sp. MPI-PUGE-AT-0066]